MEYWGHIRWFCQHCGMVYVFAAGMKYYEDPFCYTLTFVVKERYDVPLPSGKKGLIEFVGLDKIMNKRQYKALGDAMFAEGWGVLSTRVKNGKIITVELLKRRWEKRDDTAV
jgi:hypothetical protein